MSLARKAKKRAAEATVDASAKRLPPGEAPPLEAAEAPRVEPIGAPGADGNDAAREAFLRDEAPEAAEAPRGENSAPASSEAPAEDEPAVPAMTVEQLAAMGVAVIDVGGTFVGPMAVKGSTAEEWALTEKEQQTAAQAFVPWLNEKLSDTEVSPGMMAFGVLASLYGMRSMKVMKDVRDRAAAAKKAAPAPAAPPPAPLVTTPPAPAAPAPARSDGSDKRNGW